MKSAGPRRGGLGMKQRPFSELTKHFTAEDWAYVDEGLEKIREEVVREKAARELAKSSPAGDAGGASAQHVESSPTGQVRSR